MTFTLVTYLLQNELSSQTESKNLKHVTAEQCSMLELPGADENSSLESDFSLFTQCLKHKDIRLGLGSLGDLREHLRPDLPGLNRCSAGVKRGSCGYQGYEWLPVEFSS